ncbi:MAG: hypothetical protein J5630_05415 [Bacteroidaceae bacterium]|nr:hypothetical protein [Bacteroidaceae bacterium]
MEEFLNVFGNIAGHITLFLIEAFVAIIVIPAVYCLSFLFGIGEWDSYFYTKHDSDICPNGAELIFETPDSCLTCKDLYMDPSRMYSITPYSIEHGKDSVTICESEDSTFKIDEWRPLFVHRTNGRIDTLCSLGYSHLCVGYVQREYKNDNWLIVEAKQPDEILGNTHLVDKRAIHNKGHSMQDYDFEGQHIVFNSKLSDYWIASLKSPDLYGPMNIKELKMIGTSLGIEFPITLEGNLDWYACPRDIKGTDVKEQYDIPNEPKTCFDWFLWYFVKRPDRVIK